MRTATIKRQTKETNIELTLTILDYGKKGSLKGTSGIGFFDHMLNSFASHGGFDVELKCEGDLFVDGHHTVEDIGIALGQAVRQALGDKRGIKRYGQTILPMDEALILSALDISGRGECYYALNIPTQRVGNFDTELTEEFWIAFARNAKLTLHIRQLAGSNSHHIIEGSFKSVARSLRTAVSCDIEAKDEIPSTKGLIE